MIKAFSVVFVGLALLGLLLFGCATAPRPPELAAARDAYASAVNGPAATYAWSDLEAARLALARAEHAFAASDLDAARDLAYVAQRKAELAEARAEETQRLEATDGAPQ